MVSLFLQYLIHPPKRSQCHIDLSFIQKLHVPLHILFFFHSCLKRTGINVSCQDVKCIQQILNDLFFYNINTKCIQFNITFLHLQKCSRNADYRFFHRHMWPGEMIVSPHKTFDRTARKQYRITLLFTFLNQPVTSVNLFLFIRSYFY